MVSSEEKRKFIEKIVPSILLEPNKKKEIQSSLYELLLKDTNEGKLYRYRPFDEEGFSLENLRNGTLHCSKAEKFNDPFDSNIGTDFQSLCMEQCHVEFNLLEAIIDKFCQVLNGEVVLEQCSSKEQRVIKKLLFDENIMAFFTSNKQRVQTENELGQVLVKSKNVLMEMIQIIVADESFGPFLKNSASMLPAMMKNMTEEGMLNISNNNASLEVVARAKGITDDTDELGFLKKMIEQDCPEKKEALEDVWKFIEDKIFRQIENMKNLFLIGCLCTDYKNKLMWSHYADSHKGFCIEYDFSGVDEYTLKNLPLPIIYSEKRPLLPAKAFFENTEENRNEAYIQLFVGLLTKDRIWEYENEWRVIINSTESSEHRMPKISCVYLGAAISEENRSEIIEIAKELNVPVKQMTVDRGVYKLHAEDVVFK